MRRFVAVSAALLLVAACYHGPSIWKFGPVQGPNGVAADLRLNRTIVRGELLAVEDNALVVVSDSGRIVSVPVSAIERGRFDQLGELLGLGIDPQPALEQLRWFSRFPGGLTPALRARLLAAYGQAEMDVAR